MPDKHDSLKDLAENTAKAALKTLGSMTADHAIGYITESNRGPATAGNYETLKHIAANIVTHGAAIAGATIIPAPPDGAKYDSLSSVVENATTQPHAAKRSGKISLPKP